MTRDEVIKGLEAIVADDKVWQKADYYAMVCKDALALLKAEPKQGRRQPRPYWSFCSDFARGGARRWRWDNDEG